MAHNHRIFPWWAGYLLTNPLRKLFQNPDKILAPYIKHGMTVLEIGPGMGFFSIPMARMVGANGKVICIDIQDKMLLRLEKRALIKGVQQQIQTRLCTSESLKIEDLADKIDFALLFFVVHEVPDSGKLWKDVTPTLKKGGMVLFSEPKRPVSAEEFTKSVALAKKEGLNIVERPEIWRSRSVVLKKND
ncbi:MAG: class I SAM-dependent methyltransferase [Nitrospiria bacterium]